jgi:hypothetical protein
MVDRSDLIAEHFQYLTEAYGLSRAQQEFAPQTMGNACVYFQSPVIGIRIAIDRNQVLVNIGDPAWPTREWLEFSQVLGYFAPAVIAYDFGEKTEKNTWDELVALQLGRLALILRQQCEPLLRGEVAMDAIVKHVRDNRAAEMREHFDKLSPGFSDNYPGQP